MNHLRKQNRSDQNGNTMNKTTTVICEINLDANSHRDGVYHSGQKLNGNVILTLHGKQKIKSNDATAMHNEQYLFIYLLLLLCELIMDLNFNVIFVAFFMIIYRCCSANFRHRKMCMD